MFIDAYNRTHIEVVQQAAHNNAAWCDAVCRAAGAPGSFEAECWVCRLPVPRSYPNLVSLTGERARIERVVDDLTATGLPAGWGIKDSFDELQLGSRGFAPLFEAHWLWRQPELAAATGSRWRTVQTGAELRGWSLAFDPRGEASFPGALLQDPRVAFVYLEVEGRIVAGLAANVAAGVVGITNVFALPEWLRQLTAALDHVALLFPALPQVCWEPADTTPRMRALGFSELAPLKIWAHDPHACSITAPSAT